MNNLTCEDCDIENENVETTTCPYQEEINYEIVPVNLCKNCYQERCNDI